MYEFYLKENTRVSIYIGPWVLDLASLEEDGRHQHVQLRHQLEQFVVRKMLEGELPLTSVSWISFTEDSMTVSRHNLSGLQETPNEVFHLVVGGVKTHRLDDLLQEDQDLLVGETMKRSSEAAHASTEGEIWIREGRSHQVGGMGRDIASFVITAMVHYH